MNKDPVADAAEADMIERILGNLGLRTSTVPDELRDDALAGVVSEWSDSSAALVSNHRGTSPGAGTISVTSTGELNNVFDAGPGELSASIEVTTPEADTSRVTVTIGIPSAPNFDVLAEITVRGWTTTLRFPLQVSNHGSDDFALYELHGAATVLARDLPDPAYITGIRLAQFNRSLDSQE
ncbi:hypothetical protein [Rhodococcus sp. 06-235-1A]|uniref:hypothetical protein n=1 Tax=Rhodococcus sp. 06-235-1A TaxID=2022508 RepID=UPI00117A78CE|nr:hypothetical protein [Rhodococcus sp. 06-235-1A]